MGLPKSTYYYRLRTEGERLSKEKTDVALKEEIDRIHFDFPTYGRRKLIAELRRRGIVVNHKKVERIQRKFGLFPITVRKFVRTTDSDHCLKKYPNLLKDAVVTDLDEAWVADITYVRIETGFAFVAVILDLLSRKCIGWAISKRIDTRLTLCALNMALEKRKPLPGCIHHSDQGVQYCSKQYVDRLNEWGFRISMSRKGNPYDNAWAESFMKILKYEEVYLMGYETYDDVLERLPRFIEELYNQKRVHSSIRYLTPEEFEWQMRKRTGQRPLNKD